MKGYDLTEQDEKLVTGMNYRGRIYRGAFGVRMQGTNIAALHFDGQLLMDMAYVHRELERKQPQG